ncbi:uncharacterized protein LOC142564915 isoform X2 [Dermacentor variabilis]|uniref:uncharacterized protein LOC142564915 isoform X2 n=1 Tax=Dermacentor variabilis TaxID=34621 RepID=UPI003F5C2EF6
MQVLSLGFISSVMAFASIQYIADPAASCKAQLPPFGPRLLTAKAIFGEAMRGCMKEMVAFVRTVPSEKVLYMECQIYNTCIPLAEEHNWQPAIDCAVPMLQNKSSFLYTKIRLPLECGYKAEKALICMAKAIESTGAGLQGIDDAFTLGMKTFLTLGWA